MVPVKSSYNFPKQKLFLLCGELSNTVLSVCACARVRVSENKRTDKGTLSKTAEQDLPDPSYRERSLLPASCQSDLVIVCKQNSSVPPVLPSLSSVR